LIRARELTKDYGRHRAVDGVSFHVKRGEIVGLLGPNGSGKTTIMRILTGFFAPTRGECEIAGVEVQKEPLEARRHIGYLPERVALYPDIKVRRYLAFVARVHGVTGRVTPWVDEAIERCGLVQMADRYIGKLSKGYRQRVGIAQAIIHRPVVLILDEPTVGLDPRQIVEIRSLIRDLAGGATVLLSTHILPEVSITCRRVLILDRGKLVAEDTAEELVRKTLGRGEVIVRLSGPEDRVIAAFRECAGVVDVRVTDRDAGGVLTLEVSGRPDAQLGPVLSKAAAFRGWPLHQLSPKQMSLEDLFVEILERAERDRGPAPGGAA
jgi:ABC-2 type transport system ATP-binding protein